MTLHWTYIPAVLLGSLLTSAALGDEQTLLDLGKNLDPAVLAVQDAKTSQGGGVLRVETGTKADWPGMTLKAPQGQWDLATCGYVAVDLKNAGQQRVQVSCRVDNAGADGANRCVTGSVDLKPGERRTLEVPLSLVMPSELRKKLFGMRGYPAGWNESKGLESAKITQVLVFVTKPTAEHVFEIAGLRAGGAPPPAPAADKLFPMIDRYGQYMHADWPGKVKSHDDFAARKNAEAADLAAHPGPDDWDQYGGWKSGPLQKASGQFRTGKIDGRWWLVDPDGRLFWSHGIDCVHAHNAATPITDREFLFQELPPKDSARALYGASGWAPHGYYQGKSYQTFDFTGWNLVRKYGADWKPRFAELTHRRLRSWGMNTIANWSDAEIYLMHKTPYTATINGQGQPIQGSAGYWGKFPDPFDPAMRESLDRAMAREKGRSAGDPWCIGYFVANELSWGDDTSLALATLTSPPRQPAKKAFVDDLRKKYETIERLNQAWGTNHASWDALLESTTPPDKKKAAEDLTAFYSRIAEEYFRVCRDAVKLAAPNQLYLGCRFAWGNDRAVRASAKYCDVVSFNKYTRSVADLKLPEGVDKPVVIGEFHFGALDRGMFHPGLVKMANQAERAETYNSYVRGALENPYLVGTHWFQYGDQATTGRGDGENYQIGFLDVCDTPYAETIEACRAVGYEMYRTRAAAK